MNFHPFVSALLIAAAALVFGCCVDCAQSNKYIRICRMDASKEDCFEFRDAHISQTKTMIKIRDEDGNKYSFNKSGWSILVMDKGERNRR